ncbi:hypothetical protein DMJ13_08610 [halophilic archaeon]|nr:hypothetical protein DMJ13_08610 [halophilic archaeon]
MNRSDEKSASSSEAAVFTRTLAGLKRRGCGILLVGPRCDDALDRACDRFLGESRERPRRRLLVCTDASGHDRLSNHAPFPAPETSSETVRVVDRTTRTRSASGAATSVAAGTPDADVTAVRVTDESLPALDDAIVECIDEFRAVSGGLDPAELRVCVDSVAPLVEDHGAEAVFRFLRVLAARVRCDGGMGHFHLPTDANLDLVRTLAPVFDAVVEVRCRRGDAEQRWHLQEQDVTTRWLSL